MRPALEIDNFPEMTEAEEAQANKDQIMSCDKNYIDSSDFICYYASCMKSDLLDELVELIKCQALSHNDSLHRSNKVSISAKAIDQMAEAVYNDHRL